MTQQRVEHDPTSEKAWSRIGCDEWDQMTWFVKLANTTGFDAMTAGERLLWQEEFLAMLLKTPLAMPPDTNRSLRSPETDSETFAAWKEYGMLSSPNAMQAVRDAIAPHLERLADNQGTSLGPFDFTFTAHFLYNPAHKENPELSRYASQLSEYATGQTRDPFARSLSFNMSKLLAMNGHADKLHRCPHCRRLFLQLRRSARYCSPQCYTVAGMRELRERRRREREQREQERRTQEFRSRGRKGQEKRKGKRTSRKAAAKGGSRHGKKAR